MIPSQSDNDYAVPAQLWLGKHEELNAQVELYLQKFFCAHNACLVCSSCQAIRSKQFHAITWLGPEKNYTLEHLAPLVNTIAFALDPQHHHFFVLQKADCLTSVCANSLLKSIEEPPPGYHCILLAQQLDDILPTIRSRCIVKNFYSDQSTIKHTTIFDFFTQQRTLSAMVFLKELEQAALSEQEVGELYDHLLIYWTKKLEAALTTHNTPQYSHAYRMVECLQKAHQRPPMPGSSTLALKNLFLQFKAANNG